MSFAYLSGEDTKRGRIKMNKIGSMVLIGLMIGICALSTGCGTAAREILGAGLSNISSTPDIAKVSIQANTTPAADRVIGVAGAVDPNSVVKVYDLPVDGGALRYSGSADATGAFNIVIGDDQVGLCHLKATAPGKSESIPIALSNTL
jgi:F0F1-type ATP synthase membrane subunit c/vacuolar-type H+-ATPase subunit K